MPTALFEAYLAGHAGAFYDGHFADAADRRRAVQRATRPLTPAVAAAIEAQNAIYAASPARDAHLASLRRGAAAVVTGQQLGLFLGPLFTIYKAASAIRAARELQAESAQPVVPVFWLQTEDHDLPEVAQCHVPTAAGPLCLRVPAAPDEHISIAHQVLPQAVGACLAQLRQELGNLPHSQSHLDRLGRYYRPGATWSGAFGGLLAELFAAEGLVLIDPRDAAFTAVAEPLHRRALTAAAGISTALTERIRLLAEAGFSATVHVRAGAPLSFFHPDGCTGPRCRLTPAANGFTEIGSGRQHSLAALLATLAAQPLRFSTSALLRPILQDSLLPTAAYVGGPGEVAYFGQLAPLYAAFDLSMPLVVPRARIRIVEDKAQRLLERLRLNADDARRSEDDLLRLIRGDQQPAFDRTTLNRVLLEPFGTALDEIRREIESAGPGMATAIDKTRASVESAVGKLADKYDKACLHQDEALVGEVRRLKDLLHPHGEPQERIYGLSYFAARYGERAFIEQIIDSIEPFRAEALDLPLHESQPGPVYARREDGL